MQNWFHIFPKNTGLSFYIWLIFCMLPFYFIFRASSTWEIVFGIVMTVLFFTSYRLSFLSSGWSVYLWVSIDMLINIVMTWVFGYVYFSLFLAFFIGNVQNKAGFLTLYVIHLVTTITVIGIGFFVQMDMYFQQLPFIIISLIGVILLPFNMYNRIKREKLEGQLEDANEKISQLMVIEERQRIARDLHDTLGQKLSLIGLKSDLASKLVTVNPVTAKNEINDIQQTARTALKEVREMVSDMRGTGLEDELVHVKQILDAAQIGFEVDGDTNLTETPLFVEHVLSMCLKEAVTNVVKHSQATTCHIIINQSLDELLIKVKDNGVGMTTIEETSDGHGLSGMRERLEFVNGSMDISSSSDGTTLNIHVPNVIQQT
ncbi:sensor histidine kinase [Aquibacillus albus]|uniref:histidine kinase n=1 Tax=Aquibacillus albus TaxID=1168171 RepID=A0ABS2MX27_9BACI|nr:sensor histidine kinase [Aquibacillus albus]MBM7570456.1 two-component system sensor histidine kinase DesK [Aquibacillus albus]